MKKTVLLSFVFGLFTGISQVHSQGVLLPLDSNQSDFLNSYKFIFESAHNDYRSTNTTMDTVLFPRYGEYSLYWIASGSQKSKVIFPDTLPTKYAALSKSPYTSYKWQSEQHYSLQAKYNTKTIGILRSNLIKNGNSVSWEAPYF